jgi:hypothetical protein
MLDRFPKFYDEESDKFVFNLISFIKKQIVFLTLTKITIKNLEHIRRTQNRLFTRRRH